MGNIKSDWIKNLVFDLTNLNSWNIEIKLRQWVVNDIFPSFFDLGHLVLIINHRWYLVDIDCLTLHRQPYGGDECKLLNFRYESS